MKNNMLWKGALVLVLAVLLYVPLLMIENTIQERTSYRFDAVQAIAAASAGEQKLQGPELTVTVEEEYDETTTGWTKAGIAPGVQRQTRKHRILLHPTQVDLTGKLAVEQRKLGLFSTPVFELNGTLTGQFVAPTVKDLPPLGPNARLRWGAPVLSVGVADTRGIVGAPVVTLSGATLPIVRGTQLEEFKTGFHGVASGVVLDGTAKPLPFAVTVRLAGTSAFGFIPTGEVATADLSGNWPHPSFGGDFLPRTRTVQDSGFTAQWGTTALAATGATEQGFQIRLIEPVDVYQQATRSVKYGFLFIALSFAAFFVFEQLKALRIHPIQYALVGLAQAVFFLLLTSLPEHMAFAWAYLASSAASVVLVVIYLASVLLSTARALGFGAAMATLYAALFGILQSEQNALLLGSVLLFLLLAAFMLGTRKVDWYGQGDAA